MPSFNHITLLGHCTRDPELRYAKSGIPICSLGLAVNHVTGTGDTRKEDVCFIDITCFNRLAEIAAEYLAKGAQVLVAGRLTCLLYTSPSPRDTERSRMPSSA